MQGLRDGNLSRVGCLFYHHVASSDLRCSSCRASVSHAPWSCLGRYAHCADGYFLIQILTRCVQAISVFINVFSLTRFPQMPTRLRTLELAEEHSRTQKTLFQTRSGRSPSPAPPEQKKSRACLNLNSNRKMKIELFLRKWAGC